MYAAKYAARRSITALFGANQEEEVVGREISNPVRSVPQREWAKGSHRESHMDNNNTENDNNLESQSAEMRHMHMQLLAERDRVRELEAELKSLMNKKYENESSIIERLRTSQDKLREQLRSVIQSKMDLCESTALEIERLRLIIAELTNQLTASGRPIDIDRILNSKPNIVNTQHAKFPFSIDGDGLLNFDPVDEEDDRYDADGKEVETVEIRGHEVYQQMSDRGNPMVIDTRDMVSVLNDPQDRDPTKPWHLQPFPHNDHSRIDIRTVQMGDGKTWPDPFAAVDLQYTGWRYDPIEEKWSKFTSTQISSTIFETRLGNHENIIGLEQAVLTMTLGETARVWVPSRLGYGVHGAEPLIPANTDLVFELSLVAVRNEMNDFEAANDDTPLDQRQLDHINSDEYGGSQLTSNNVKALEQMTGDGVYSMEDDVYDTAPRGRGNFQDL